MLATRIPFGSGKVREGFVSRLLSGGFGGRKSRQYPMFGAIAAVRVWVLDGDVVRVDNPIWGVESGTGLVRPNLTQIVKLPDSWEIHNHPNGGYWVDVFVRGCGRNRRVRVLYCPQNGRFLPIPNHPDVGFLLPHPQKRVETRFSPYNWGIARRAFEWFASHTNPFRGDWREDDRMMQVVVKDWRQVADLLADPVMFASAMRYASRKIPRAGQDAEHQPIAAVDRLATLALAPRYRGGNRKGEVTTIKLGTQLGGIITTLTRKERGQDKRHRIPRNKLSEFTFERHIRGVDNGRVAYREVERRLDGFGRSQHWADRQLSAKLTDTEREIISLLIRGLTMTQIAATIGAKNPGRIRETLDRIKLRFTTVPKPRNWIGVDPPTPNGWLGSGRKETPSYWTIEEAVKAGAI